MEGHRGIPTPIQQMITQGTNQNYQLLGAQILHQKLEKEGPSMHRQDLKQLK